LEVAIGTAEGTLSGLKAGYQLVLRLWSSWHEFVIGSSYWEENIVLGYNTQGLGKIGGHRAGLMMVKAIVNPAIGHLLIVFAEC
jgi:hypothetical protein